MRRAFLLPVAVLLCLFGAAAAKAQPTANLKVPFIFEAPGNRWVSPWKNACEEAAEAMVDQFYLGTRSISSTASIALLNPLFSWENKVFGYNSNTNADETARLVNEYSSFMAEKVVNPTLSQLKAELTAGHPVISFHYGFGLKNPRIPFLSSGSSYHVLVLTGYDDAAKEFLVRDPGDPKGLDGRYTYAIILSTLGDYSHKTGKVDGQPTVLFTSAKLLVKGPNSGRIYLIQDNKKHHITSPTVFKKYNLSWKAVTTIPQTELDNYADGKVFE